MRSIRRRLLLALLGLWTLVGAAVALIALDRSGHEIGELLDAQLAQTAHVLRALDPLERLPVAVAPPQSLSPASHPYEAKLSFQHWQGERLASRFGAAPSQPLAATMGFSDQELEGTRWRVFGLPGADPAERLFVAQNYTIRRELVAFLTFQAMQPILWSLPVCALLIWLIASDGLRPLQRFAHRIARRSAERLEPLDEPGIPSELQPLTDAMNGLMQRLAEALGTERRFAADASHELRTPFAIIRTHAQIARRSTDPGERQAALDHLIQGVDRATRSISQLLTLARLQGESQAAKRGAASLARAVAQAVADRQTAARTRSIDLVAVLADTTPGVVEMPAATLGILLGNLLDNSLKYTPAGGRIAVTIESMPQATLLQVMDSGPGIPPGDRQRVFERFYRSPGQTQPGAGLGLAIVQRICDLYGLGIVLSDGADGAGLCVAVTFPEPARP